MEIPEDMDVPQMRRDTKSEANVRWLLRNLAVRNNEHPEFRATMEELKNLRIKQWSTAFGA